jgi:hypothetical protein
MKHIRIQHLSLDDNFKIIIQKIYIFIFYGRKNKGNELVVRFNNNFNLKFLFQTINIFASTKCSK